MEHLWYRQPAAAWEEGLPCGNGRLGCVQFGGASVEHIQLNEDSVWSGGPMDRVNPDSAKYLPEIRRLLREGKIPQAETLCLAALSGTPSTQRTYQTLGDLYLFFNGIPKEPGSYTRSLDPESAVLSVEFSAGNTRYTRELFSSYPAGVIALRLTAEGEGRLSFQCRMGRDRQVDRAGAENGDSIWYGGGSQEERSAFCAMLRAGETDGQVTVIGETLAVEGASHIVLYFTACTAFRFSEPKAACRTLLDSACAKGYEAVRREHLADFRPRFQAMELDLGGEDRSSIPTDERLSAYGAGTPDPGLEALYFSYARYLLLSCSRPGSLPANLQGLWNNKMLPPWDSKYTININTQMNYWPAESCALPECHLPLFDLIGRMAETGEDTARRMYGCRGFVAHHNTDLYADTAPQDLWVPATFWPMGGAWLCTHIWKHYAYTLDREFLAAHYGDLEKAVLFFVDFLERDEDGYPVTSPSVSPENTYILEDGTSGRIGIGPTMDNEILWDLLTGFLEAGKVLGKRDGLTEQAEGLLHSLRPLQTGTDGRLLEWRREYREAEPGHRHISHLYALYPSEQITPDRTPELARAARKTLEYRLSHGGGHTGWSRAWIISLWARLHDGDKAYENLSELLKHSTFPNLWDNHPDYAGDGFLFQIDGNFGAAAAITEMLAQSLSGRLLLLPALPSAWNSGAVRGLRVRGNAVLNMTWKDGTLAEAELSAQSDFDQEVCCGPFRRRVVLRAGGKIVLNGELR